MNGYLFPTIAAIVTMATMPFEVPGAQPGSEQDANLAATGPRGPVGPHVPLSDAEKKQFAHHITVVERTAAAVQAACQRAVKEGVRVVFLPAGEYVFESTARVPGGVTVLGEGSKTVVQTKQRNTRLFNVDGDLVRFTRLKLQGADTTRSTDNETYGISVNGKKNVRIDHCELLGFSYATALGREATAQVDHCTIQHNLREGYGYGVALYSGAYVLVADNEFSQNRHSLASNGELDWRSPQRVGKYLHKPGVRKAHWEFIHNWVSSNDLSLYELCAVDTHPGMDATFVVEGNLFENLRHGVGIRDGSGLIQRNLFRNLRSVTSFRPLVAISIAYGTHNGIPVEDCMPQDIDVRENAFLQQEDAKYEKHLVGKAENIAINGKLVPETKVERPAPSAISRLQEMGEDGVLNWCEVPRPEAFGSGSVEGTVTDEAGRRVQGATVFIGERSAQTDVEGRFAFAEVSEAASFVAGSKPGFELGLAGVRIRAGERSTVNLLLAADRTPPAFLATANTDLTHTTATLAWQTSEPTTGQVEYGAEGEAQAWRHIKAIEDMPATTHRMKLTDLRPVMSYRWRVKAIDVSGNAAMSDEVVFSTAPVPDPAPPTSWGYYAGAGRALWGRTRQEAHTGKFSAFLKGVAPESGSLNIALIAGHSDGYSGAKAYSAEPGAKYRYSFWTGGDFPEVALVLTTWKTEAAASKDREHVFLRKFTPTEKWTQYQGEFTMPADVKKFVLLFQVYRENIGRENLGVLYVDDVQVKARDTAAVKNSGAENE